MADRKNRKVEKTAKIVNQASNYKWLMMPLGLSTRFSIGQFSSFFGRYMADRRNEKIDFLKKLTNF